MKLCLLMIVYYEAYHYANTPMHNIALFKGVGYTCNPPRRAPPPQGASPLWEHMVAIGTQLSLTLIGLQK